MAQQVLGLFPNLGTHRTTLGWEVRDLVTNLDGQPSETSIRRLENGYPIRLTNVNRVFDVINKALDNNLDRNTEVIPVERR